jgi:LacI family transcriptional regulator, galactose operon repressor
MAVTIKDVAHLAGVSTATVSRVLNRDTRIAPATFEKVSRIILASGYRRNNVARNLKTRRTHTVGFLTPEIANDFFMYIAEGVESRLQQEGYSLIICNTAEKSAIETSRIDLLSDQQADGIIIIPATHEGVHYRVLDKRGIPAVVVDRLVADFRCDAILVDNINGSYRAAARFFEAGVRRIGFIGGRPDLTTAEERYEGFRRAHDEYNIPLDESLVRFGDFHVDSGFQLADQLLSLPDPPRHLFIANYFMHVGATRFLLQSGLGEARGIQTAGFDDMDLIPLMGFSAFTISQPMKEMGTAAAELLLSRIEGRNSAPPELKRLKTGVIVHRPIVP